LTWFDFPAGTVPVNVDVRLGVLGIPMVRRQE
jgi:hypothetical protein